MKKALKIIGITLGSVIGLSVAAVCVVVWMVFTPAKLTPLVKEYVPAFVSCETNLDTVDLTFFSTFPHFGLRLNNLALINPMDGAPSDTVASIKSLVATVDVKEYLTNSNIIINGVYLSDVTANIFVNADSVANYDVFISDTTAEEDTSTAALFNNLAIQDVKLEHISASYLDLPANMNASISNINLAADVEMEQDDINADVTMTSDAILFALTDSTQLTANVGDLDVNFDGSLGNYNDLKGTLNMMLNNVSATMAGTQYADSLTIQTTIPMVVALDSLKIALSEALLGVNEHQISLTGNAEVGDDIRMDMNFSTNDIELPKLLQLAPKEMVKEYLDGISLDGIIQVSGNVRGIMNDTLMPLIAVDAVYSKGAVVVEGLGHDLYDVAANVHANIDLNEEKNSGVTIHSVSAKTGKSSVSLSGDITDLLNEMNFDVKANAQVCMLDIKNEMPEYVFVTGWVDAAVSAKCNMDALTNVDLKRINAKGTVNLKDLDVVYEDSTFVNTPKLAVDFVLPSTRKQKEFQEVIDLVVKSDKLNVMMTDFFKTDLNGADFHIGVSDVMDTTKDLAVACDFDLKTINFIMDSDTISASVKKPKGSVKMFPKGKNTGYACALNCDSLYAKVAEDVDARTGLINVTAKAEYDSTQEDVLLQWNPDVQLNFNQGQFALSAIEKPIKIAKIKCDFNKKRFLIDQSKVILGNSDFQLTGIVDNIIDYIVGEDILKGDLKFTSDYTDVMELMDMVSGMGDTTEVETETTKEDIAQTNAVDTTAITEVEEDNPFMVPLGVDVVVDTDIKKALVGKKIIEHVGGGLTIRDGVLVLEEMGFTCDAAQMQLTAMYRSARKNHLFAGLDFHLIDISIADLIDIVPDIDTVVPMLKAFSGKAEFHLAAETYLKSNYDPKFSTLRGAAAIKGRDLVVMDNETYETISKMLLFNKKKTKNVVDSINVEMTVFRNEVELFPFVVSMDKYQAVLSGYHTLDMNYKYHVSLTKSPLPMKLGLNILGTVDDMKYRLGKCEYKKLYKPERRGVVDEQILHLKQTISSSLRAGVKDQDALIKD